MIISKKIIMVLFLCLIFSLTGCGNKKQIKSLHYQLKTQFEFTSNVKNLQETNLETYTAIQAKFNESELCIVNGEYYQAAEILKKLEKSLENFNLHKAIIPYYINSKLQVYKEGQELKSLEMETQKIDKLRQSAFDTVGSVGQADKLEEFVSKYSKKYKYIENEQLLVLRGKMTDEEKTELLNVYRKSSYSGSSNGASSGQLKEEEEGYGFDFNEKDTVKKQELKTITKKQSRKEINRMYEESQISITTVQVKDSVMLSNPEINVLDNVANLFDELCYHMDLEYIGILKDDEHSYIYIQTTGKRMFNSSVTNPKIRATSYMADDFGRFFANVPSMYNGYVIDMVSYFQNLTAEKERIRLYNYWINRKSYNTGWAAIIEATGYAVEAGKYKIPYPIHIESSRVIVETSSLDKFLEDKIVVTDLFAETKLYLRGVRNKVDLSEAIDLSQ